MISEIRRGKILRMNSSGLPQIQLFDGEILDDVPMYYPAGLYAKPISGDVIVGYFQGDVSLSFCIPCGPFEEVPDLKDEESVVFNPMNSNSFIKFTEDGIEIGGPIKLSRNSVLRDVAAIGDLTTDGARIAPI